MKMHDNEIDIDADLVARLVAEQFPDLAGREPRLLRSTGTVNAIYRLGGDLYARLPRMADSADIESEWQWLPRLAPHLPLPIPEPVGLGEPSADYPLRWAVYRWLGGESYQDGFVDEEQAAEILAGFVRALRQVDPTGAPRGGRRPLLELDTGTRSTITASVGVIDDVAALAVWDDALTAPVWTGPPTWIHTDLLRPNLLVRAGRLCAVIDFGGAGVGDPAMDEVAAWAVFGRDGRRVYRDRFEVDDGYLEPRPRLRPAPGRRDHPLLPRHQPLFRRHGATRTIEQILLER